MTKAELEKEIIILKSNLVKLEKIIRKPFKFTEEHTRIVIDFGGRRMYITKPFDVDNRLDIHCDCGVKIIPNANNSFYIEKN